MYSRVLLSFGIALIPLVLLTRDHDVMGTLLNWRLTSAVAMCLAGVITILNVCLIYQQFFGA